MDQSAAVLPVRNYDDLIGGLRARQAELGLTNEKLDELSGLPSGYVGKLFGPSQMKNLAPYIALGVLLEALGVELFIRADDAAAKRMAQRFEPRERPPNSAPQGMRAKTKRLPGVLFKILAARSAKARRENMPPERRSEIARRAAEARWSRQSPEQRQQALAKVRRARGRKRSATEGRNADR